MALRFARVLLLIYFLYDEKHFKGPKQHFAGRLFIVDNNAYSAVKKIIARSI